MQKNTWFEYIKKIKSKNPSVKLGILIAAYGSSNMQSSQAIRNFQFRLEQYFGLPVRIAFTSETLRKRLAHAKTKSDSVLKALKKMEFERFTHVAVQSLHLISGIEYHEVLADTEIAKESGTLKISFGLPLLQNEADMEKVVQALINLLPSDYKENDAVIWMGHGTTHNAECLYHQLFERLNQKNNHFFIACMEGMYTIDQVFADLKKIDNIHRIWLLPLLTVVGKHALFDMAGDQQNSWKNRFIAKGYECIPYLKGLAESKEIQNIWIQRIEQAIISL